MGLIKRDGYTVKGINLVPAYAKIVGLYTRPGEEYDKADEYLYASFGISNSRDNLKKRWDAVEVIDIKMEFDRSTDNLYKQAYDKAKEDLFKGWEDDIVTPSEENS